MHSRSEKIIVLVGICSVIDLSVVNDVWLEVNVGPDVEGTMLKEVSEVTDGDCDVLVAEMINFVVVAILKQYKNKLCKENTHY